MLCVADSDLKICRPCHTFSKDLRFGFDGFEILLKIEIWDSYQWFRFMFSMIWDLPIAASYTVYEIPQLLDVLRCLCIRNADLVGMNDETQVGGDAGPVTTYPPPPDTRARPASDAVRDAGRGVREGDNALTDGDSIPMPVRVTKPRRPKDRPTEGDVSMSSSEDLTAPAEGELDAEQNVARKKRRRPKPTAEEGEALMPATDSAPVQPSPGEARRLKVHIKAQPGAAVRIQNAPPAVAPKPAYRSKPHDTSTETDI